MLNHTSLDLFTPYETWLQVIIVIIQLLETVFGSLASLGVILVFFKRGRWNGATSILMVNLAVSDTLICAVMIPLSTARVILFPNVIIAFHIVHESLLSGLRFASISTLVAISYDRMESVSRPLRLHVPNATAMIATIWVIAIPSFLIPIYALNGASFRLERMYNEKLEILQLYNCIVFVILCVVLFYNYRTIQMVAKNRVVGLPMMFIQGTLAVPKINNLSAQLKQQKEKVVNLSRLIVSSVVLLWMPYLGLSFAKFFMNSSQSIEMASSILLMIGYANHVIQPILYAAPSSHWREAALKVFPFFSEKSKSRRESMQCQSQYQKQRNKVDPNFEVDVL